MANECNHINPLKHSGTSQLQRVLTALDPGSAPIDDRSYADLILFAKEYAQYLNYYDKDNNQDGNWQPLMQMDIAVVLATLANERMPLYEAYRSGIYTEILQIDTNDAAHLPQNEALCKQLLEAVFDLLFTYIYHLDARYALLPEGSEEKSFVRNIIAGRLKDAYLHLYQYYQLAKAAGIVDDTSVYIPPELIPPTPISAAKELLAGTLSADWQGALPNVPALSGNAIIGKIKNLVTHNLFNAVADALIKSIGTIATYADNRLLDSLANFPGHTPHYALYLTFIQLFQHAKNDLNALTEKHLKFYYQQVLQLSNNPAEGDQAHLLVQLQKNTDSLLIPKGTAFKAGKDGDGKEIFYATTKDFTVNQATVKSLKAVLAETATDAANGAYQTLYASDPVNSGDGAGGTLVSPDKSWYPFGNAQKTKNTVTIGFAVSSPELNLQEGDRTITLNFTLDQPLSINIALIQKAFQVKLTGSKGWYTPGSPALSVRYSNKVLSFILTLDGKAPAITGYDSRLHPGVFNTSLPLIQFTATISKNNYNPLSALSGLSVSKITVSTSVEGARKLQVSTDTGAVDPSKPFMPFGASPHAGSAFLLGSKEIFQKKLTDLEVLIQWDKLPPEGLGVHEHRFDHGTDATGGKFRRHYVSVSYLENGIWQTENESRGLFTGAQLYGGIYYNSWLRSKQKYALPFNPHKAENWENNFDFIYCPLTRYQPAAADDLLEEKFSAAAKNGFVKFELSGDDFGHDDYLKKILNVTITSGTDNSGHPTQSITRPDPPYTPVIKSVEINYTSSAVLDLTGTGPGQPAFFHLYPFGIQQQVGADPDLAPAFPNEGELYIGLDGTEAPENISLLFQVSEGSANPLKSRQTVSWSYLSGSNQWEDFDPYSIEDHTNGLLQSGLIVFSLPQDIAQDALLMGGSQAWLRASVEQDADAICKMISIDAQGIAASFADINNTGNYFKSPVPANTISKLVISDPLIKKISQPYDSFGGRMKESDAGFYTRVSERLRHKQRAIAIWDYEHLVLQQFPEIYKVKCLNHTGLRPAEGSNPAMLNEMWPGHVTVIPVPDLRNRNAVDPLLPYTSLGTLTAIRQYLQTLISPFVKLDVLNPQFEEVQFDFKVRFLQGYDAKVFGDKLNGAIEEFLSPWAFEEGKDIEFGGRISKSVVLKFIEDQYYVDYVTCFKMNHWIDIANGIVKYDVEEAATTTSRSILVSYHDPGTGEKHIIHPILTETATCECS